MKVVKIFLTAMVIFCCLNSQPARAQDESTDESVTVNCDDIAGATSQAKCIPKKNPDHLTFIIKGKTKDNLSQPQPVTVTIQKDGRDIQEFALPSGSSNLGMMDLNFDGRDDLQMLSENGGAGPNAGYIYWLYEPKAEKFVRNESADVLSGADIKVDPKTKTIRTSSRDSCCEWTYETYGWRGDKLALTQSVDDGSGAVGTIYGIPHRDPDDNTCIRRTDRYNDAQRIVSTTFDDQAQYCDGDKDFTQAFDTLDDIVGKGGRHYTVHKTTGHGKVTSLTITYNPPVKPPAMP